MRSSSPRRGSAGSSRRCCARPRSVAGRCRREFATRCARTIRSTSTRDERLRGRRMKRAAGLAYREEGPEDGRAVLLVHGFPESSYMWRDAMPALGAAGWRALAPDLPGYGDSDPDPPGTWEHHVDAIERFVSELDPGPVALVTHDWGVL